ncbi:hypothetical protein [Ruminococcus sp.]|uniref:hypothetical protein n=1 Tax=Ruminococcus sp. TaxID=41978 RepID=UPI00258EAB58|nr:hypothetical protein [Ruminococcus sp.]MCR5022541.1 hypothetical protein [Ruminococcus sp.]
MGAITSVFSTAVLSAGEGSSTYIQQAISGVDFKQVLDEIVSVAPQLLPTLVAIIAFKKALRWVIGTVKGA